MSGAAWSSHDGFHWYASRQAAERAAARQQAAQAGGAELAARISARALALVRFVQPGMVGCVSEPAEPAAEMPISEAREHLADVVNRAVYGGEATYLTRRGRRLAVVVSAAQLAADDARARQDATVEACRQFWQSVAGADEATRATVRAGLDELIEAAEDIADLAVLRAIRDDRESGAEPVPWEQVKAELGL
jgi:prevent-host-death family protein